MVFFFNFFNVLVRWLFVSFQSKKKTGQNTKKKIKLLASFVSISTLIYLHPFQLVMLGYWFIQFKSGFHHMWNFTIYSILCIEKQQTPKLRPPFSFTTTLYNNNHYFSILCKTITTTFFSESKTAFILYSKITSKPK